MFPGWSGLCRAPLNPCVTCRTGREALIWIGASFAGRFDFQIPVPDITTVGGYSTTNLIVNYEINDSLSAHVRAENLLNSNFHEYVGFPNPGIYVRAGITYRFKPGRP
jgi:outer membrane receptor protein involved in Fe transport